MPLKVLNINIFFAYIYHRKMENPCLGPTLRNSLHKLRATNCPIQYTVIALQCLREGGKCCELHAPGGK